MSALMLLAACGGEQAADGPQPAIRISFEPREAPEVFLREGPGRRTDTGTEGLWAVVGGLGRAESAMVRNLASGAEVRVALFAGRPAGGALVELSSQASDALGIGADPVEVRVVAVRDEPTVATPHQRGRRR